MKTVVNVHDFKTHYSKYLARVKQGETITVSERGKPVAQLNPLPVELQKPRQIGKFKGKIWVADDFDEPMMWLWDVVKNKS